MIAALLALVFTAHADTGEDLCKDWTVIPDTVVTSSGMVHDFRIDTARTCRAGLVCSWALSSAVGSLDTDEGYYVSWSTPAEPPAMCEPLDTTLVATCVLWEHFTKTESASLQVRCTDEERQDLYEQLAEGYSVAGGGCSSPKTSAALLVPLGLLGLRRRLRR